MWLVEQQLGLARLEDGTEIQFAVAGNDWLPVFRSTRISMGARAGRAANSRMRTTHRHLNGLGRHRGNIEDD